MKSQTDKIASEFLGKRVSTCSSYNPEFLVAVPRKENRLQYNINSENLEFLGWDVWHAYEFSSMTENGLPVTKLLKLKYNCANDFIIESKSLKLYLNSFNMSRFGKNSAECLSVCKKTIEKDLSQKLQTEVEINFIENNAKKVEILTSFENITKYINEEDLLVTKFKEAPELLETENAGEIFEYRLAFDSLRSNCRVTHQPDFGDVYIYYKSKKHIKEDSLVKYLTSFRSEYHFHEECCEMIFKRLYDILEKDDELYVCALYTRRGGIDICPARWKHNTNVDELSNLLNTKILARAGVKQ